VLEMQHRLVRCLAQFVEVMPTTPLDRLGVDVEGLGGVLRPLPDPLGGQQTGAAEVLAEVPRGAAVLLLVHPAQEVDVGFGRLYRKLVEFVLVGAGRGVFRSPCRLLLSRPVPALVFGFAFACHRIFRRVNGSRCGRGRRRAGLDATTTWMERGRRTRVRPRRDRETCTAATPVYAANKPLYLAHRKPVH